jgi:quinol-cytochrome oxidoreductase complex cytochrome b subunit
MRPSFFHHLHPPTIPAPQARWRYTLGAGGMAVLLTVVVGLTGLLETFYYSPTPETAAQSVQIITYLVPFGGLIRNIHYWSAQFLVGVLVIHTARVVLTSAYSTPRRFNYWLGLASLVIVLLLDFTGYMLRWDNGIQWALVVGTNLLKTVPFVGGWLHRLATGGSSLGNGASVLLRFYAWHIFGLAFTLFVVAAWHLFRVRRDGGIAVPPPALRTDQHRISRDVLVRREVLAALIALVAVILLATFAPAPIAPPIAVLSAVDTQATAPWFFLWVQQLLKWGNPFLLGICVPVLIVAFLGAYPLIFAPRKPEELGRWFAPSNRLAHVLFGAVLLLAGVLTALALLPEP